MSDHSLSAVGLLSKYRTETMGLGALLIFLFHHWKPLLPPYLPNHPQLLAWERWWLDYGFCGVDLFFLLSGLGTVYALKKHPLPQFYLRRVQRVLPAFLVITLALGLARGDSLLTILKAASGYTFFLEDMYQIAWFIPAILLFYLASPLLLWLMERWDRPVAVTLALLALWYIGSLLLPIREDLYGMTNRFPSFLLGILAAKLEREGRFPRSRWVFLALPLLFFLGVLATGLPWEGPFLPLMYPVNRNLASTLLGLSIALALPLLLEKTQGLRWVQPVRTPLRFWGTYSLEVYLVQLLTVHGVLGASAVSPLLTNLLLLALVSGLGWLLARIQP